MPKRRGRAVLFAVVLAGVLVWGWGLPWLAERPGLRSRIETHRRRGINPSATYYTEMPAAGRILRELEARD